MNILRFKFSLVRFIVYLSIVIIVAAGLAWWFLVRNSTERMFWSVVDNNLKTSSFTRQAVQDDGLQRIDQVIEVSTTPTQLVNGRTTITQTGDSAARVVTENIGTPRSDYVRYTEVETSQKNSQGQDIDFSDIKNVWGKSGDEGNDTNGQLYNESVLGIVPAAKLTPDQRRDLISLMKKEKVYEYKLVGIARSGLFGRPTYTYSVQVQPEAYIGMLKQFARAAGLTQLASVDPSQYRSAEPVTVDLKVDGWTQRLVQASYGGGSRVEELRAYGSTKQLQKPPRDFVPVEELQRRLQALQ